MEEDKKIDINDIRAMCYKIIDIIDFYNLMERTHSCNDCAEVKECGYAPDYGQQVRYNCYFWRGADGKRNSVNNSDRRNK